MFDNLLFFRCTFYDGGKQKKLVTWGSDPSTLVERGHLAANGGISRLLKPVLLRTKTVTSLFFKSTLHDGDGKGKFGWVSVFTLHSLVEVSAP